MTCALRSVCLQFCPGASACDNYAVSCPGLVLLKKHWRLIELAVFLEFRLPFCPNAHCSGGWRSGSTAARAETAWDRDTETEKKQKREDVICSKKRLFFGQKFPPGLSYFMGIQQQTERCLHLLSSQRAVTAAEIFPKKKHVFCERTFAKKLIFPQNEIT